MFILPTLIGFALFILYPILESIRISFLDFNILRDSKYIGLDNYIDIFRDKRVATVYGNTFVFTIFAVFFNAGVGLLLAVALNRRMPVFIRNLYRSIILPGLVSVFGVFLIRQFFKTLPQELLDAARVDGAGNASVVMAAVTMAILPVLIVFIIAQRWIIEALTRTGIKG